MKKEKLLQEMMETMGRARRGQHEKKERTASNHQLDDGVEKKKKHHKMSPVAESTLILLFQEGSMNQRNIANRMNVTGQAVSELMKKFEEKELILREAGELNNENIISLTEKGKVHGGEYLTKMCELAEELFEDFSQDELNTLQILVKKMKFNQEKTKT